MKSDIILLSFVIAGMLFANLIFADPLVQVNTTVNPVPIAPGSEGYIQLTFTNSGTTTASNVQITGMSSDPSISVSPNGIVNLGSLANGKSTTAVFKFLVSSSASSGLYTVGFTSSYCSTGCTEVDSTVVITVQSSSAVQVTSIRPDTLSAGKTTTLNFDLVNEGNDVINNIILTWQTPNNEILPLGLSNRQYISSLIGHQTTTIPINVSVGPSVSPGIYPLSLQLVYFDKSGSRQTVNSTVGIKIGGATDFDISLQQYSAETASLSIANIGVNPATSVSVAIPQQNNFAVTGASSVFLGTLNSGDFSVASFQISSTFSRNSTGVPGNPTGRIGNSTAGTSNALTVEISYSDTSGTRQTVQKEITLNLASQAAGSSTSTFQRNSGLGLVTIIEIVVIVIAVAVVVVWYLKRRKNKIIIAFLGRMSRKPGK
ncbi:MAG: hypothetical protein V1944_01675 [Candidatus Aenigmatarchaeota archaeon]